MLVKQPLKTKKAVARITEKNLHALYTSVFLRVEGWLCQIFINMMTRIKGIQVIKYSSGVGTSVYDSLDSAITVLQCYQRWRKFSFLISYLETCLLLGKYLFVLINWSNPGDSLFLKHFQVFIRTNINLNAPEAAGNLILCTSQHVFCAFHNPLL